MRFSSHSIDWPLAAPAATLLFSLGALATAYTAQYIFKLEPCILCLYQRVPFATVIVLSVLAFFLPRNGRGRAAVTALCAIAFLIGSGVAVYQVGVEQHWWVSGCSGRLASDVSLSDLRAQLLEKPPKPCDDDIWTVFGLSMATYNIFFSLALSLAAFGASRKLWEESRHGNPRQPEKDLP